MMMRMHRQNAVSTGLMTYRQPRYPIPASPRPSCQRSSASPLPCRRQTFAGGHWWRTGARCGRWWRGTCLRLNVEVYGDCCVGATSDSRFLCDVLGGRMRGSAFAFKGHVLLLASMARAQACSDDEGVWHRILNMQLWLDEPKLKHLGLEDEKYTVYTSSASMCIYSTRLFTSC